MGKQNILRSTAILTLSGILSKTIDFMFRAFYSRALGSEGLGLFSLVFSFHALMLNISTAGLGVAVSKIISEQYARCEYGEIKKTMSVALTAVTSLCALVIGVSTAFASEIAEHFLNEPRCATSIVCLSPSVLFMGISYCIKGYFYASRKVFAPASSEFVEQAVKIVTIRYMLKSALPLGIEHGCEAVFLGLTIGEFSSCAYLCFFYKLNLKNHAGDSTSKNIGKALLKISVPVMLTSFTGSFLRMQEEVLVVSSLRKYGLSQASSLSLYGSIHGMVMPLIVFPLTLFSSFFTLLVPEISRASAMQNPLRLKTLISKIYRFTACFGFLVTSVILIFSDELSALVYNTPGISGYLTTICLLAPIMFMDSVSCRFLNGMGKQSSLLFYSLSDSLFRLVMIYTVMPKIGILGFILVIFASNILTFLLSLTNVLRTAKVSFELSGWLTKHIFCGIATFIVANWGIGHIFMDELQKTVLGIAFAVLFYLLISNATSKVTKNDFSWLLRRFFSNT